jgi:DNA-binding NarL/FixJ family response regulator
MSISICAEHRTGRLAPREIDIYRLMVKGQSAREIAGVLRLAPQTVRSYAKTLYAKLGIHRRIRLATDVRVEPCGCFQLLSDSDKIST